MFESCGGCCLALILIPLLCCGLIAGGVAYTTLNAPDPPLGDRFQPSNADAQALESEFNRAAIQGLSGGDGWFYLRIYQQQLSSWLALRGQELADSHDRTFPFEDVQVGLDDGVMRFYAKFSQSGVKIPLLVEVEPTVNSSGKFELDITHVDVGGLNVPEIVFDAIKDQLRDALNKPFENWQGDYQLNPMSLSIDNGQFDVQGYYSP